MSSRGNDASLSAIGPRTMARAIRVDRKLNSTAVIDVLTDRFMPHGACQAMFGRTMMRAKPE